MEWVLEAAEDVTVPPRWPLQVGTEASWVAAALWCGNTLFEARVRGILNMVDKQRDSVKMTVTKALTAWLRTSIRDRGLPTFDPAVLDEPGTTLYVLSPSDGTVAPLAVTLMEQLIRRQRIKVAQWQAYPRIGMFLDELPNTPLPKILQYFAEARGLVDLRCRASQLTARRRLRRTSGPRHPRRRSGHPDHVRCARGRADALGGVLGRQDHPQPAVLRPQPRRQDHLAAVRKRF